MQSMVEGHKPQADRNWRAPLPPPSGGSPPRPGEDFSAAAIHLAGHAALLLGWRPADFWNATPAELATALAPLAGEGDGAPASSAELSRLMEQYPDG